MYLVCYAADYVDEVIDISKMEKLDVDAEDGNDIDYLYNCKEWK